MSRTSLVVGIGNPLQGPDGFGPAVVDRLRSRSDLPSVVELVDAHTDLLSYMGRFGDFDDVVLADAFLGPGTFAVVAIDETVFSAWSTDSPSSHEFSAALVVRLFRRLHPDAKTRFTLVGLDVDRVGSGVLSDAAVDAGADAVLRVLGVPDHG